MTTMNAENLITCKLFGSISSALQLIILSYILLKCNSIPFFLIILTNKSELRKKCENIGLFH